MTNGVGDRVSANPTWETRQVYVMAAICLTVGIAIGYLFRGSESVSSQQQNIPPQKQEAPGPQAPNNAAMPSLDDMKHMADVKAQPLLEKLKANPEDSQLLVQTGDIYKSAHQFKDAVGYYDKALKLDPKNVAVRTEMASCMYYGGDVDGALSQLRQALHYDPKDANSLFNLGMIEWQGKQDTKGALAAWQELLKSNPQLSAERSAQVQKLIAEIHGKTN